MGVEANTDWTLSYRLRSVKAAASNRIRPSLWDRSDPLPLPLGELAVTLLSPPVAEFALRRLALGAVDPETPRPRPAERFDPSGHEE